MVSEITATEFINKSDLNSEGGYAMTSGGGNNLVEDGRSQGGYDVMSSMRNTQVHDPSVFSSKGRRARR